MGENLRIEYDPVGDILYLDIDEPDPEQVESEVLEGVIVRRLRGQDALSGIEVHGVGARGTTALPVGAAFRLLPS